MLYSLRSAVLICAALSATSVAPAQAEDPLEPLLAVESPALPKVVVPELLGLEIEPQLAGPEAQWEAVDSEPEATEPGAVAETPVVRSRSGLAATVAELRSPDPGSRELECLAAGIYFESKSEPLAGQLAVGQVIANRANSGGRFPQSYCGVLFQPGQFSFVRGRSWPSVTRSSRQWQNAVAIAKIVDQELHSSPVGEALFFHARYVSPRWRLKRVA